MGHYYRDLKVWTRALEYVTQVYSLTQTFPKDELYGLTNQLRRAATSIALNIAEGSGGSSNAEFIRFLEMARRSGYEVITGLEIAFRLQYCQSQQVSILVQEADEIGGMISGLINRLKREK